MAAAWARSVDPGAALEAVPERSAGGGREDTSPNVTKVPTIRTASPSTTMAGRVEVLPGVGGRCGAERSPPTAGLWGSA